MVQNIQKLKIEAMEDFSKLLTKSTTGVQDRALNPDHPVTRNRQNPIYISNQEAKSPTLLCLQCGKLYEGNDEVYRP
jgi:hypothetical protein